MKKLPFTCNIRPCLYIVLSFLFVWGAPVELYAQDPTVMMSRPDHFHDREAFFPDFPFAIGDTKLVNSPYPDSFFPLLIPTFEGLPRLGIQNDYGISNTKLRTETYETSQERRAVTEELTHNLGCYLSLLCLQMNAAEFSTEKLMIYKGEGFSFMDQYYNFSGQVDQRMNYMVIPRFHIEGMAAGMLTKEKYMEYFCPSGEHCSEGHRQRQGRIWAGPQANEFKKRAAYKKFVDTEVPELIKWSSELSREVALVGRVVLPTYDFQKKGFEINISPIRDSGSTNQQQDLHFWPRDPESSGFDINSGLIKNVFLAIPPEKAESIKNKLKTKYRQPNNLILYTVIIGEIYSIGPKRRGATHTSFGGNVGYLYDIKGANIRFYTDPELTELVYETKF